MGLQGRTNVLLKSKSSNTRVKPRAAEKTSRSSAAFKALVAKKRGVYVENRESSTGPYLVKEIPPKIKAPPRSRPGAKTFLASVLTILSKATASTQCAEDDIKQPTPKRPSKMSKTIQPGNRPKYHINEKNDIRHNPVEKKPKYKYKDDENFKSKRESPSHRESAHNSKDNETSGKLTADALEGKSTENQFSLVNSKVARSVLEGNRINLEKEMLNLSTTIGGEEKDERLFSLFVNIIETVYNEKPNEEEENEKKNITPFKGKAQMDDLLTLKGPKIDAPPTNNLNQVIHKPFDLKWCVQDEMEEVKESTHNLEVDGKSNEINECKVIHEVEKKQKYRSKALNDEVNKEPKRVVVLKSKNELQSRSSSSFSKDSGTSDVSIKWADYLPQLINAGTGEATKVEDTVNPDSSIAKTVMEGNRLNMEKKMVETTTTSTPEKDEKLYSLFVNLLESVYAGNSPQKEVMVDGSPRCSKLKFEMDTNVAQKLDDMIHKSYECAPPPCENCHYEARQEWRPKVQLDYNRDPYNVRWSHHNYEREAPVRRARKKVRRQVVKPPLAAHYAPTDPRQPNKKKNKKQELLAIFKQQLSKVEYYKEPETFYDALRVMARNKRQNYNSAYAIRCAREGIDESDYESAPRYKKRKVAPRITPNTRSTRNSRASKNNPARAGFKYSYPEYRLPSYEAESTVLPDSEDSYHSLAVYGYDYEGKPYSGRSLASSIQIVDNETNYKDCRNTVGSQCCNN